MKKTIIGLLVSILVVGCGGGGSEAVDNTGNLENQYGFFGGETKFQKYNIVGHWTFYQGNNAIYASFYEDGSGKHNGNSIDYGVNRNGTKIVYNTGGITSYLGTRTNYLEVRESDGSIKHYDCYDVEIDDRGTIYENIVLCPN